MGPQLPFLLDEMGFFGWGKESKCAKNKKEGPLHQFQSAQMDGG